jgi:hypothetical protein
VGARDKAAPRSCGRGPRTSENASGLLGGRSSDGISSPSSPKRGAGMLPTSGALGTETAAVPPRGAARGTARRPAPPMGIGADERTCSMTLKMMKPIFREAWSGKRWTGTREYILLQAACKSLVGCSAAVVAAAGPAAFKLSHFVAPIREPLSLRQAACHRQWPHSICGLPRHEAQRSSTHGLGPLTTRRWAHNLHQLPNSNPCPPSPLPVSAGGHPKLALLFALNSKPHTLPPAVR